ncbi:MAG: Imm31 family immunity protein [Gammaproteobacteria bacterium]
MSNKFKFYEIVKISSKEKIYLEINDKEGVILGMSQNEHGVWGYAVAVDNDTWDIDELYLNTTGKFSSREKFYSNTNTLKVIVNEFGEGEIDNEN